MSCETTVINIITNDTVINECKSQCEYKPIYGVTSVEGRIEKNYLEFKLNDTAYTSEYNKEKYKATEMRIYITPLHKYDGTNCNGELMIYHNDYNGLNSLILCIPISIGGPPITLLGSLINKAITLGNSGDYTLLDIPDFNISELIPFKKPFYTYEYGDIFKKCNKNSFYIVFKCINAIAISETDFKTLTDGLSPIETTSGINSTSITNFAYNRNGPTYTTEDEIYIDCSPTGDSKETEPVYTTIKKDETNKNKNKNKKINSFYKFITKNETVEFITNFLVFFLIIIIFIVVFFKDRIKRLFGGGSSGSGGDGGDD
jgi:carbonic anhydrase